MTFTKTGSPREIERKFLLKRMPDGLTDHPHEEIARVTSERAACRCGCGRRAMCVPHLQTRQQDRARGTRGSAKRGQFDALWPATAGRRLTEIRYDIPWKEHTIEVDVYTGRHDGVVVAEVEFDDERTCRDFVPPDWIGEDVTGKSRYSNVMMAVE